MSNIPEQERLSAYLDGELTAAEQARVEDWIARDPQARRLLDELRALGPLLQSLPRQKLSVDLGDAVLSAAEGRILSGTAATGEPAAIDQPSPGSLLRAAAKRFFNVRSLAWATTAAVIGIAIMLHERGQQQFVHQDGGQVAMTVAERASRETRMRADANEAIAAQGRRTANAVASRDAAPQSFSAPSMSAAPEAAVNAVAAHAPSAPAPAAMPAAPPSPAAHSEAEERLAKASSEPSAAKPAAPPAMSIAGSEARTSGSPTAEPANDDSLAEMNEEDAAALLVVHADVPPETVEKGVFDRLLASNALGTASINGASAEAESQDAGAAVSGPSAVNAPEKDARAADRPPAAAHERPAAVTADNGSSKTEAPGDAFGRRRRAAVTADNGSSKTEGQATTLRGVAPPEPLRGSGSLGKNDIPAVAVDATQREADGAPPPQRAWLEQGQFRTQPPTVRRAESDVNLVYVEGAPRQIEAALAQMNAEPEHYQQIRVEPAPQARSQQPLQRFNRSLATVPAFNGPLGPSPFGPLNGLQRAVSQTAAAAGSSADSERTSDHDAPRDAAAGGSAKSEAAATRGNGNRSRREKESRVQEYGGQPQGQLGGDETVSGGRPNPSPDERPRASRQTNAAPRRGTPNNLQIRSGLEDVARAQAAAAERMRALFVLRVVPPQTAPPESRGNAAAGEDSPRNRSAH